MAQRYYFFNSTTGDRRKYQAQHLAEYFGSVLSSGLIHINNEPELLVNVETGKLNTVVDAGKALIKGHLYENTIPLTLEHSIPEANLDRIDRIVLRLDLRNSERNILLHVKEGSPSSNPEPPELQRDNFIHELSLAQIRVRANTSSLDVNDLQDERLIDELCGVVQSMINLPTTRFQEQWDAFMDSVKGEGYATLQMLDEAETSLNTRIDDVVEDYVRSPGYASASHSNNIYNVSLNPAPVEYKEGMGVVLKATKNTTGQPKINVNGLGVKSIYQANGLEVPAFKENTVYTLRYNGLNFILQGEGDGVETIDLGNYEIVRRAGGSSSAPLHEEAIISSYKITSLNGSVRLTAPIRIDNPSGGGVGDGGIFKVYVDEMIVREFRITSRSFTDYTFDLDIKQGSEIKITGEATHSRVNACVVGTVIFKGDRNDLLIERVLQGG